MKIECQMNLLLEYVNLVQKAVSNKSPLTILECILLTCDSEGFKMTSTDQSIGIKTNAIDCEIIEEGSIALPSRFFSDIVRRLPEALVTIKTEGLIATISCLNSEFKIVGRNPEEFPELPEIEKKKEYKIEQGVLKNLIRQTNFAICIDANKPNLMGALLEIKDDRITMVSCDSFRVVCSFAEKNNYNADDNKRVTIPAKAISELYKLLIDDNDDISFYLAEKHILFDLGNCIIISRLVEGEFIDYQSVIPEEFETKIIVEKDIFLDALERALLVSMYENKKNPVRMKLENNSILFTTSSETGNSVELIDVDMDGSSLEISFNPKFLHDFVKVVDEDKLRLDFNSSLSPCVIKPFSENATCKYMVLPLRLKNR